MNKLCKQASFLHANVFFTLCAIRAFSRSFTPSIEKAAKKMTPEEIKQMYSVYRQWAVRQDEHREDLGPRGSMPSLEETAAVAMKEGRYQVSSAAVLSNLSRMLRTLWRRTRSTCATASLARSFLAERKHTSSWESKIAHVSNSDCRDPHLTIALSPTNT